MKYYAFLIFAKINMPFAFMQNVDSRQQFQFKMLIY